VQEPKLCARGEWHFCSRIAAPDVTCLRSQAAVGSCRAAGKRAGDEHGVCSGAGRRQRQVASRHPRRSETRRTSSEHLRTWTSTGASSAPRGRPTGAWSSPVQPPYGFFSHAALQDPGAHEGLALLAQSSPRDGPRYEIGIPLNVPPQRIFQHDVEPATRARRGKV